MNTKRHSSTSSRLIEAATEENKAWRVILVDACLVLAVFAGYIMVVEPQDNKGLRFIHQVASVFVPERAALAAPSGDIVYATQALGPASDALLALEAATDQSFRIYGAEGVKTARTGVSSLSVVISGESYFKRDSHAISPQMALALDIIGSRLWSDPSLSAIIFDHGDGMMPVSSAYVSAEHISSERASAARDRIVEVSQIAFDRVAAAGMSDTRPIASNGSAAGRKANRRLEVVLTIDQSALPRETGPQKVSDWREALGQRIDAGKAEAKELSQATLEWMDSMGLRSLTTQNAEQIKQ